VFIALGGTSFAAVTLSRNSVRSEHIKNGQVKRADLARNAVTSRKVRNGSLLSADFRAGQLPAGPQGPKGDTGPKGDPGQQGPAGTPAVYKRTRLTYSGTITTPDTSASFVQERVVGTFTKDRADSVIELVALGHASGSGVACSWQLRIDGANNQGAAGAGAFDGTEANVQINAGVPYTITSVFQGLAAGSHQVTLWVRGVASNCTNNPGNYTRVVYVNETS